MNEKIDLTSLEVSMLRRTPTQERSREKVVRITEATASLLEQIGYHEITVKKILETSGVAPPTFYAYFSDCNSVLDALSMRFLSEVEAVADQVGQIEFSSFRTALHGFIDAYFIWFRDRTGFRKLWISGRVNEVALSQERRTNAYVARQLRAVLTPHFQQQKDDSNLIFLFAVEMADQMLRQVFRDNDSGDVDWLEETKAAVEGYLKFRLL